MNSFTLSNTFTNMFLSMRTNVCKGGIPLPAFLKIMSVIVGYPIKSYYISGKLPESKGHNTTIIVNLLINFPLSSKHLRKYW